MMAIRLRRIREAVGCLPLLLVVGCRAVPGQVDLMIVDGGFDEAGENVDGGDSTSRDMSMASAAWIDWRMPNPAATGLPNPSSYDTSIAGLVKDNVTGLVWQSVVDANSYTLANAKSYCSNLALAGGGWRVPSRIELVSLIDFTTRGPAIDVAFPNTPLSAFWSSSPAAGISQVAWFVNFSTGGTGATDSRDPFRVRCVR